MHSHHAYLFLGTDHVDVNGVSLSLQNTYAVTVYEREQWGIGDSRALISEASRTDGAGRPRAFVVVAQALTLEAQNALLKLLEEPPERSVFFFYLPREAVLLPTLRSRFLIADDPIVATTHTDFLKEWQQLSLAEQLTEIEARTKKKDAVWLSWFRLEGLRVLQEKQQILPPAVALRLQYALLVLGSRGASNKMLLEEAALLLATHVSSRNETR